MSGAAAPGQLLGLVEFRRGHNEAAHDLLQQTLALRPNEAEYLSNLTVVLQALGQSDGALDHYRRAVALKPDYPEAQANLGTDQHPKRSLGPAVAALPSVE